MNSWSSTRTWSRSRESGRAVKGSGVRGSKVASVRRRLSLLRAGVPEEAHLRMTARAVQDRWGSVGPSGCGDASPGSPKPQLTGAPVDLLQRPSISSFPVSHVLLRALQSLRMLFFLGLLLGSFLFGLRALLTLLNEPEQRHIHRAFPLDMYSSAFAVDGISGWLRERHKPSTALSPPPHTHGARFLGTQALMPRTTLSLTLYLCKRPKSTTENPFW